MATKPITLGIVAALVTVTTTAAVTLVWNDTAGSVVLGVGIWATLFLLLWSRGRQSGSPVDRDEHAQFVAAVEQMDNDELRRAIAALDGRERELLIVDDTVNAFAVQRDKFVCLSVLQKRGARYPF